MVDLAEASRSEIGVFRRENRRRKSSGVDRGVIFVGKSTAKKCRSPNDDNYSFLGNMSGVALLRLVLGIGHKFDIRCKRSSHLCFLSSFVSSIQTKSVVENGRRK
jgi:hypothetical protein